MKARFFLIAQTYGITIVAYGTSKGWGFRNYLIEVINHTGEKVRFNDMMEVKHPIQSENLLRRFEEFVKNQLPKN